jgi:hypothetical protein
MKITTQTTHDISFEVKEFRGEEGGMHVGQFGDVCKDMAIALRTLELARAHDPKADWVIVLDVVTQTNPLKGGQS